ncbi:4'-phosphopantetheinyl transferase superfamily protein [soil metagenome]
MQAGATGPDVKELLRGRAAHVWIVPPVAASRTLRACTGWLSAEERERCNRQRDEASRTRFALSRAALRRVLALCLGRSADGLVFTRNERGKPAVCGIEGLDFSFADCRDVALIALAASDTGVDVEHDREPRHAGRTARRIFHAATVASMDRLPSSVRSTAFLDAWTLREAHVKAVGGGLFHTPDALPFDPDMPADGTPRLVHERNGGDEWSVARFLPSPGTRAAVVVRGAIDSIHIHDTEVTLRLLDEEGT